MEKFTADNFLKGFLIDDELMAGISESADAPGVYTAYVVRHSTGETLGVQEFTNLFEAIRTLNDIPREWVFDSVQKCGGGKCGSGKCGGGGCGAKFVGTETTDPIDVQFLS
jgi:hypothetical protein